MQKKLEIEVIVNYVRFNRYTVPMGLVSHKQQPSVTIIYKPFYYSDKLHIIIIYYYKQHAGSSLCK